MKFYIDNDIEKIYNNTKKFINKFSDKKILITGGNGFLGKYFVKVFLEYNKFLKKPLKLVVLDLKFKKNDKINDSNVTYIEKDVSKNFSIGRKFDYIIHAAGIASPFYYRKKPIETLEVSIEGTKNCLDLARKYKSKFIFFSSSEIYGDPDKKNIPTKEVYRGNVSTLGPRACYDESKRLGETLCYIYNNKYNLDINIIRPFNVYGPGMKQKDYRIFPNFISNILNNKKINIYGTGKQTRTYCYITDAIEGFIRVLCYGKKGEVYNIGNTNPEISVSQIFKVLNKIHNKKILSKFIKHPKSYPSDEPQRRCPDLTKAKTHLYYKPEVKLEDGLINFLNWAKIHYKY